MMRGAVAWLSMVVLVVILGAMQGRADASVMHRIWTLRYVDHTMFCHRWQNGADGIVYGDGKPFAVVCEKFGAPYGNLPQRYAWDAEPW